jgi:sulfite reductase alpha subunit-like flavoprotein
MVYGVRNNTAACYYKDFLVDWFAKRHLTSQLYLACSRTIEQEETPQNVHTIKGYVQDVLKRLSLEDLAVKADEIIDD